MKQQELRSWELRSSRKLADYKVFSVRADLKVSPRTGLEHEFYILESVHWVNIVALTTDRKLIMVNQYRHGSNTVELEIPGGMMDSTDPSPLEAGLRELREETGYEGNGGQLIGQIYANPAILNNICYTVLVTGCELKHAVEMDGGEDLATRLIDLKEIPDLIRSGQIGHPLVVVALYHFELWQRQQNPSL